MTEELCHACPGKPNCSCCQHTQEVSKGYKNYTLQLTAFNHDGGNISPPYIVMAATSRPKPKTYRKSLSCHHDFTCAARILLYNFYSIILPFQHFWYDGVKLSRAWQLGLNTYVETEAANTRCPNFSDQAIDVQLLSIYL